MICEIQIENSLLSLSFAKKYTQVLFISVKTELELWTASDYDSKHNKKIRPRRKLSLYTQEIWETTQKNEWSGRDHCNDIWEEYVYLHDRWQQEKKMENDREAK